MSLARRALLPIVAAVAAMACAPAIASAETRTVCASGCGYTTVGAAVAAASADDVIEIGAGTFVENVVVNKRLSIFGAGAGQTTLRGNAALNLQAGASGSWIEDLTLQGSGGTTSTSSVALNVTSGAVDTVTLQDTTVTGAYRGLYVQNSATTSGWEITSATFTGNTIGAWFHGDTTGLSITGSHFDGNDYGLYTQYKSQTVAGGVVTAGQPGVFDGVSIFQSTFNDNAYKGMYFEAVSDSSIVETEIDGTGTTTPVRPAPGTPQAGIDVNVKYGSFENLYLDTVDVTNTVGTGMVIKGRNDGTRYGTVPATLSDVTLYAITATGSTATSNLEALGHGVAFGYDVRGVTILGSRFFDNEAGGLLSYADDIAETSIEAIDNWFGCNAGPADADCDAVHVQPGAESIDADPWVVMGIESDTPEIGVGGEEAMIFVSWDENSDGEAAVGVPPVTVDFATDLGTVDPVEVETCGCEAVTTLTSGSKGGTARVTATLDNQAVRVSVRIVKARLDVSPGRPEFGSVPIGSTSAPQTLTVTNVGNAPATVDEVVASSGNFSVTEETCTSGPLAPEATCTAVVVFSPRVAREITNLIKFIGSVPQVTAVATGIGIGPFMSIAPGDVDFGTATVGSTTAPATVVVTNSGNEPLIIDSVTPSSANFVVEAQSCTASPIAPAGTCSVDVAFSPKSAKSFSNPLKFAGNAPRANAILTGTGSGPAMSADVQELDFGSASAGTTTPASVITVTNTGDEALVIDTIRSTSSNFVVLAETCTAGAVAPGQTCVVQVVFSPLAAGPLDGTVRIRGNMPRHNVTVRGTGS